MFQIFSMTIFLYLINYPITIAITLNSNYFLFYFIFYCIFSITLIPLLLFSPNNHHAVVQVQESFSLFAQSFHPVTPNPRAVSPLSMNLSLFCLLGEFVQDFTWMKSWYLSFSGWLISLNIVYSRSIHAVARVKFASFAWPSSIPLCKCPIVTFSTQLLMNTLAASMSWWL